MILPLQQFPTKSPTILSALKAMRNIRHSFIMASGHLPELTKHCTTYFDGNGKSSNYSSVTCYNCGKKGHISSKCTHTAMMTPGLTTSAREWMKVQPIIRSAETKEVNGKTWHCVEGAANGQQLMVWLPTSFLLITIGFVLGVEDILDVMCIRLHQHRMLPVGPLALVLQYWV